MKKLEIHGINFELPEKYEPIKLIGKGTYGAVCSAINKENNKKVAIKKLSKIEDLVSQLNAKDCLSWTNFSHYFRLTQSEFWEKSLSWKICNTKIY